MAKINVDIKGIEAVVQSMQQKPKELVKLINAEMKAFGMSTVAEAKRLCPVSDSMLQKSISYKIETNKVIIVASAPYAAYVEFGTRKFAAQYVATLPQDWQELAAQSKGKGSGSFEEFVLSIQRWVKLKGIGATYNVKTHRRDKIGKQTAAQTIEADAYAIALYIIRNGTRPHPFLYPAVKNNIKIFEEKLNKI